MQITLSHLIHKGCFASAKGNRLLVFGDLNLSDPLLSFIRETSPHEVVFQDWRIWTIPNDDLLSEDGWLLGAVLWYPSPPWLWHVAVERFSILGVPSYTEHLQILRYFFCSKILYVAKGLLNGSFFVVAVNISNYKHEPTWHEQIASV